MFAHVVEPRLPYVKTVGLLNCLCNDMHLQIHYLNIFLIFGKEMEENKCYFEFN